MLWWKCAANRQPAAAGGTDERYRHIPLAAYRARSTADARHLRSTRNITYTAAELAAELGTDTATAERLYAVAVNEVEAYSPQSPSANKAEALIRFAFYLRDADPGTQQSQTFGPKSIDFVTNHASAFKNCGAAMLLARYRRRRAGSI